MTIFYQYMNLLQVQPVTRNEVQDNMKLHKTFS